MKSPYPKDYVMTDLERLAWSLIGWVLVLAAVLMVLAIVAAGAFIGHAIVGALFGYAIVGAFL